ncbi:putative odorant receptor 59c [Teleopsis dalmanni]|uniref:putative odorant receptor 59c n=1 Tax=Teleopsis dalmanni TaxID=139649 RepID=UPI0018CE8CA0|nr:putative odorant receptor 59c [Teleopsis dalmanni]
MIFMFEIFPCCWCVNELIAETGRLTNAVYNCNWYEQDMKFRRALMIFMLRTHKQIQILAGNLVPVSLQSFIAIVKFSFSMFTLLNEMRQ